MFCGTQQEDDRVGLLVFNPLWMIYLFGTEKTTWQVRSLLAEIGWTQTVPVLAAENIIFFHLILTQRCLAARKYARVTVLYT
jgi:hypothetical protein